jgi:hypothetical protein
MTNEIQNNEENAIAVFDESQIKQFQSLYYLFKGKRDTDIKLFHDFKEFTYSDIIELNAKIYKKLELHEKVTDLINVTVGLDKNEIRTFGNWYEFTNTDWNISAKTKYISIEWDFNVILPNQTHKVPQTHTLRIRIGNNLNPSELIQVVFQGSEEYELEEVQSQMVCKIDFVNSQICSELKAVVCEWYDALPKNSEDHKLIRFILKHEVKIQNLVVLSFLTAGIILLNYLFPYLTKKELSIIPVDPNQRLFLFLTSSVPLIFFFYRFGFLYADRIMKKRIGKLKRNPMFEFTKGDKNRFKEVADSNKKLLNQLGLNIFYALSTNIVAYFIGLILKYMTNN